MITKISGAVERVDTTGNSIELAVGPVVHEVLVTELVRRSLQQKLGQPVTLHTLEYLEGKKLDDAIGDPITRRAIATVAIEVMIKQIFDDGFFHADPHPGNVIVMGDPSHPVIALIDLGLPPTPALPNEGFRLINDLLAHAPNIRISSGCDRLGPPLLSPPSCRRPLRGVPRPPSSRPRRFARSTPVSRVRRTQ